MCSAPGPGTTGGPSGRLVAGEEMFAEPGAGVEHGAASRHLDSVVEVGIRDFDDEVVLASR